MSRMPFFAGSRGRIHYRRWDSPAPVASLVFLHGRGQHSGDYHRFASAMNAFGVSVWAVDHYGHGLSEGDAEDITSDVESFVANLALDASRLAGLAAEATPELPLSLMGHSLGAATAVRTAASTPFASVVLCATPPPLLTPDLMKVLVARGVPILAVHGEDDRMVPIDSARAVLGDIELIVYENAGHDLLHEKVHLDVTDEVAHFLPIRADAQLP